MQPAGARPARRQRRADRARDAGAADDLGLLRLRGPQSSASAARRSSTARRSPATPRIQATWLVVTGVMVLGLAVVRHDRPARQLGRRRRRRGAEPAREASRRGERAPGPGDRAAVDVDVPLPGLRRRRDDRARAARSDREVEFHVTSLDVAHSFWAYELGGQGRRDPGHRQRRVRQADCKPAASRSAAPSSAACGTAT